MLLIQYLFIIIERTLCIVLCTHNMNNDIVRHTHDCMDNVIDQYVS